MDRNNTADALRRVLFGAGKGEIHIKGNKKSSGKKTALKIFLVLLVIVIAGAGGAAYWQRENIKAYMDSKTYTKEELSEQMTKSKEEAQQAIEQYDIPVMRDFTVEEEEKIRKGELTPEEAMQLIMTPSGGEQNSAENGTENAAAGSTDTAGSSDNAAAASGGASSADSIVAKYVTQVYSLKAYYIGQLGAVEGEMRSAYVNSGRDKAQIPSIIQSYLPRVASLENECDSQIAGLVSSLRSELSAAGQDTSIADKIYDAYVNEKAIRKAYYLSQY